MSFLSKSIKSPQINKQSPFTEIAFLIVDLE